MKITMSEDNALTQDYILGVKVNFGLTMDDVMKRIEGFINNLEGSKIICTTNPEFIMTAQKDAEFKTIINESALSLPDGWGVLYAKSFLDKTKRMKKSKLFPLKAFVYGSFIALLSIMKKSKKEESIRGVDLTLKLCDLASKKGYSVFLLGGYPKDKLGRMQKKDYDLSQMTANKLKTLYPNLNIVGATSKYGHQSEFDEPTVEYIKKKMSQSNIDKLDLILVAYAYSKQERWLERNLNKINCRVGMGVGGTFDYISGNVIRAPQFFIDMHIEWIFRLIMQPWRIKRIIMAFPIFPVKIYLKSIKK